MVDVLYRIGGRELLDALGRGVTPGRRSPHRGRAPPDARPTWLLRQSKSSAAWSSAPCRRSTKPRGGSCATSSTVRVPCCASRRYGLGQAAGQDVDVTKDGREIYRALRTTVAQLDASRRQVRRWNFTIPANAPTARRQFEEVQARYVSAFREAIVRWPALAACGAGLLKEVGHERASDVQKWAAGEDDATVLDDLIKEALRDAWNEYVDERPDFERRLLQAGDAALRTALTHPTFRRGGRRRQRPSRLGATRS